MSKNAKTATKARPVRILQAMTETEGLALVDVRKPDVYAQSHPAGSVNVPMYQPLDWSKPTLGKVRTSPFPSLGCPDCCAIENW
jgi:rhodanese-related sulfurtransferase